MKSIKFLPLIVAVVTGILLMTACEKKKGTEEVNISDDSIQIREDNFKTISIEQYISGTWVIEPDFNSNMLDTLIFNNGYFTSSCDKPAHQYTYFSHEKDTIEICIGESIYKKLAIERITPNRIIMYKYSSCYDYTQIEKNSVFNRINK